MKRLMCVALLAGAGLFYGLQSVPDTLAQEKRNLVFEVYRDVKDEFRWRLKAGNGQLIAVGHQGYGAKADCMHAIEVIQKGAASSKIVEGESKK